jgi:lipopolysaccharide transport system ATP-binding protein
MGMVADASIRVEDLSKKYRLGRNKGGYKTLRDTLTDAVMGPFRAIGAMASRGGKESSSNGAGESFWALNNISFEVGKGEVMGVIGRNGAGKSTLLKILSRITEPTRGFADVRGRVGSLLEVGTGFHPELTGRENIYLNGAILGMRRAEIEDKFDEIVAFAEVEKFIDTPVKHYSSGMYLRLAFAVAAHLDPEILLVDEVLAVGDAAFQKKCLGKMGDVVQQGRTVLFVSHDMTAISQLASRCLLLDGGQVAFLGETDQAIREYTRRQMAGETDLALRKDRQGDGVIRMRSARFLNSQGETVSVIGSGEPITIEVQYGSKLGDLDPRDIWLDMTFKDALGHPAATLSTRFGEVALNGRSDQAGQIGQTGRTGTLRCHAPSLTLADEVYYLDLWLAYRTGLCDYVTRAIELQVSPSNYFGTGHAPVKRKHGPALIQHTWSADASRG